MDAERRPLELRVSLPAVESAGLSMLAPGGAQLFLGEPVKAGAHLAGTAALGVAAYFALRMIVYPDSFEAGSFYPAESDALIMLNGAGIGWLAGGALSALEAYLSIQAQQPAFEPTAAAKVKP